MKPAYFLTDDFAESEHTAPLRAGKIVRDITMRPADPTLPDVAICRVFDSRQTAIRLLKALQDSQ